MLVIENVMGRKLRLVHQTETSECGLACLAMISGYFGCDISLSELRQKYAVSLKGLSLSGLIKIARQIGLNATAIKCDLQHLKQIDGPALLHWNFEHFVILENINHGKYKIFDPSRGILNLNEKEVSNMFTGIVVQFSPGMNFAERRTDSKLGLIDVIGSLKGFKISITQILLISVILEIFVLSQPVLIKRIVDTGLQEGITEIVFKLFGLLLIIATALGVTRYLRDYSIINIGTSLNREIVYSIFNKTMKLPLSFFEKRPIGHLIDRYRVIDQIQRFLTSSLPASIIDGIMTLVSLAFVFWLSWQLGLLSIITLVTYFFSRTYGHTILRNSELAYLNAKGEESGYLIETLRCIQTIKTNNIEDSRLNNWSSLYTTLMIADRRLGSWQSIFGSIKVFLTGINIAFFILFSLTSQSDGTLTAGTVLALLLYNSHFIFRSTQLVEKYFEYKLLELQLNRIDDVISTNDESIELDQAERVIESKIMGQLTVNDLHFSYSVSDGKLLNGVNFNIEPGDFVAITGQNGAGKTTLMKLILGLYCPEKGEIQYDGVSLKEINLRNLRSQIGCVTQDDELLTGTVAENIALFDPQMDVDLVEKCAEIACVKRDIESMPMGYNTKSGDLGSPFSEGQKQKILLARALYKQPSILLMDEGTANLDSASEKGILDNLKNLPITKIFIAHRSETIKRASRVLILENGVIVERNSIV